MFKHTHSLSSPLTFPCPHPPRTSYLPMLITPSLNFTCSHVPFPRQVSPVIFADSFTAISEAGRASPLDHYSISVSPEPQGVSQSHLPAEERAPFQNLSAGSKGSPTDPTQSDLLTSSQETNLQGDVSVTGHRDPAHVKAANSAHTSCITFP